MQQTHKGIETFPEDNADFAITSFEEGWNSISNTSLKNYVKKQTSG